MRPRSLHFALFLASLAAVPSLKWLDGAGVGWQMAEEPPPWQAHTGSIAAPLSDGSMLLIGGQAGRHGGANFDCHECTSEVWLLGPKQDAWSNLSQDVPWDPRWGHSVVTMPDDTVWMFFGCCERGRPTVMLRDVWAFNPTLDAPWTRLATSPPFEGIQAASLAARGTEVWVVGGWSMSRATLSHVVVFDTDTLKWVTKSKHGDAPWDSRADHASAVSPDGLRLFIFGGQHAKEGGRYWTRLKDAWMVPVPSARPSEWIQLDDLPGARSSPALMVLPTGWLLTLGGHWTPDMELLDTSQNDVEGMQAHHEKTRFDTYNDVVALDISGAVAAPPSWQLLETAAPWPARDDCAAGVTSDGTVLVFGGGTRYGGGGYLRDVWRLPDALGTYGLQRPSSGKGAEL